jgi:hypothetical protein
MSTAAAQINTYHCLCSSLLLATTHHLPSLPRRASPCLDSAVILVLQPTPDSAAAPDQAAESNTSEPETSNPGLGYSLLLGTTLDTRATIIRRSDGFEKRYLLRCGQCRLVVGYELDEAHFTGPESAAMDVDGGVEPMGQGKRKEGMKIAYILPGGVMSTEAMVAGKKISERDVALGEEEKMAVAAWG